MSNTPVKRTPKRSRLRRPLAAVAIGSLGVLGMAGPAEATTRSTHFEGTYSGGDVFTVGDQRCSYIGGVNIAISALVAFERDDGPDWGASFRSCGTLSGNPTRFSIAGNFTITTPQGGLTGSFGDSFVFGGTGGGRRVNYITGGTGEFEGATGECVQTDNVITPTGPTSNAYSGTVTCDITAPK